LNEWAELNKRAAFGPLFWFGLILWNHGVYEQKEVESMEGVLENYKKMETGDFFEKIWYIDINRGLEGSSLMNDQKANDS